MTGKDREIRTMKLELDLMVVGWRTVRDALEMYADRIEFQLPARAHLVRGEARNIAKMIDGRA